MDNPPPAEDSPPSPKAPNLKWSPPVVAEIDAWLRTGVFPFPELGLRSQHQFQGLSRTDLRLVHHLSTIYRDLQRKGVVHCTAWVERLPMYGHCSRPCRFTDLHVPVSSIRRPATTLS
jgi:hypothetical protein